MGNKDVTSCFFSKIFGQGRLPPLAKEGWLRHSKERGHLLDGASTPPWQSFAKEGSSLAPHGVKCVLRSVIEERGSIWLRRRRAKPFVVSSLFRFPEKNRLELNDEA